MFVRCGKILVILALVVSTGAHWGALQTVAWTAMLAGNLRTYPVAEAVSRTFDGKHPCCLCKAVAAGKESQKKTLAIPMPKLEFPPVAEFFTLVAPPTFRPASRTIPCMADWISQPPTPPPRPCFV